MKYAIVIGVIILAVIVGALCVYIVGVKRVAEAIGQPLTREAKQKQVEKAEEKAAEKTKLEVQEVRDATLDENIDLGRKLSERGRLRK